MQLKVQFSQVGTGLGSSLSQANKPNNPMNAHIFNNFMILFFEINRCGNRR
ncbi:MAG: hypothetical protein ACJAYJ_004369 [Saprospiraceae bacterium]|jgi:hypothetical protein